MTCRGIVVRDLLETNADASRSGETSIVSSSRDRRGKNSPGDHFAIVRWLVLLVGGRIDPWSPDLLEPDRTDRDRAADW